MAPVSHSLERLAQTMRETASLVESSVHAFENLKKAIEAEGYQVVWHMHAGTYSLVKLNNN